MTSPTLFSSASVEWETPQELFDGLHHRFGFTLDVCATAENAKCPRYFTRAENGLAQDWGGERCWMNPPYGKEIGEWVRKAQGEAEKGALVVGLLPVRTDTRWWQQSVIGHADVRYIAGRLRFGKARNSAPFPSALVLWWGA